MHEDLLDIVFEEDEVIFSDRLGFRLGERRKQTNIRGTERSVDYFDRFGHVIGTAREIPSLFGSTPYVEFRDKNGRVTGKAYVNTKINGQREIVYTTKDGKPIRSRIADEKKILSANALSMESAESVERNPGNNGGGAIVTSSLDDRSLIPMTLCVFLFIELIIYALFAAFRSHVDTILRYSGILCVYASCPLMVAAYLLCCRITGKATAALRIFRLGHLIAFAVCFAFQAFLNSAMYFDPEPVMRLFSRADSSIVVPYLLLCFSPIPAYGLFSGIWTLLVKKQPYGNAAVQLSRGSVRLLTVGCMFFNILTQAVTITSESFGSGGISGFMLTIASLALYALLVLLVYGIFHLPYAALSKHF